MMELREKKILVVGAGKSGLAVAHFLAGKGAFTVLTDARVPVLPDGEAARLRAEGVDVGFWQLPPGGEANI
ncbi:MAG: hypothetical protein RQM92_03910 [Candidatus Syntrophopropionicum ammoniitolerans]